MEFVKINTDTMIAKDQIESIWEDYSPSEKQFLLCVTTRSGMTLVLGRFDDREKRSNAACILFNSLNLANNL